MFHHRAVVPAAVEHHHCACCGQPVDIALEIPACGLAVGGFGKRHHVADTGVQVFAHHVDGAALAGRVAAFEDHDDAFSVRLDIGLHAHELPLQPVHRGVVILALHLCGVGIAGGDEVVFPRCLDGLADGLGSLLAEKAADRAVEGQVGHDVLASVARPVWRWAGLAQSGTRGGAVDGGDDVVGVGVMRHVACAFDQDEVALGQEFGQGQGMDIGRDHGIGGAMQDFYGEGQAGIGLRHAHHMGAEVGDLPGIHPQRVASHRQAHADVIGIAGWCGIGGEDRLDHARRLPFGGEGGDRGDHGRRTDPAARDGVIGAKATGPGHRGT